MSNWLLTGLADGLALSLFALALALVHGVTRVLALSLGGIHALAPFLAWQGGQAGLPAVPAAGFAILAGALLAAFIEVANQRPMSRAGASPQSQVLASLGVYIVTAQAIAMFWTSDPLWFPDTGTRLYRWGDVVLSRGQLAMLAVPPPILLVFFLWLRASRAGLRLRALADNPVELALRGIDTEAWRVAVTALAGALVSTGALLAAGDSGFDAGAGLHPLLLALAALVIAGRHALAGVVAAAIAVGVLRASIGTFGDSRWQDAGTFVLLLLMLLLRPHGLFGQPRRLEASS